MISSPTEKKSLIGLSEDNTRDILSHNITVSPNYYRLSQSRKSDRSQNNSIQKEDGNIPIQKLKSAEKAKWEQVIELVNLNLKGTFNHHKTKEMMSAILNFSMKNKEELNHYSNDKSMITPTTITYRQEEEQIIEIKKNL